MCESTTRPILVRDGNVVPTAVGVSEPSLTLVEFERGIGFLLARGLQVDSFRPQCFLEQVTLWRTGEMRSKSQRHRLVVLGDVGGLVDTEARTAAELEIVSANWQPVVFFLSVSEHERLLAKLEEHDPERVLREAFDHAHRAEELRSRVLKLKVRWEEQLRGFQNLKQCVQPVKQTIRLSLPPKPAARETVRLELPPRKPPEDPPPPQS